MVGVPETAPITAPDINRIDPTTSIATATLGLDIFICYQSFGAKLPSAGATIHGCYYTPRSCNATANYCQSGRYRRCADRRADSGQCQQPTT